MLHILWLILKWILILLGILIGLVLLLLLLILFVRSDTEQVQKKANGGNQGNKSLGRGKLAAPYYFGSCFLGRRENSNKNMCFWSSTIQIETKLSGKKKKQKLIPAKRSFCSEEADRTGKIFQII